MKEVTSQNSDTISAIIPCYNSEDTIERSIQSLMGQTRIPEEIIIVNDGSSENRANLLEDIASQYPIVKIIYQENQGLPSARNTGIKECSGTYALMLDADDTFDKSFISKALLLISKREDIAVVTCGVARIVNGSIRYTYIPEKTSLRECLLDNIAPACALFSKKALLEVGGYDETMTSGYEDWDLNLRLLAKGYTFEVIDEILFNYYDTPDSLLKTTSKKDIELRKVLLDKHRDLYNKHIDIFIEEVARLKDHTQQEVGKVKSTLDYKTGMQLLKPFRTVKFFFSKS